MDKLRDLSKGDRFRFALSNFGPHVSHDRLSGIWEVIDLRVNSVGHMLCEVVGDEGGNGIGYQESFMPEREVVPLVDTTVIPEYKIKTLIHSNTADLDNDINAYVNKMVSGGWEFVSISGDGLGCTARVTMVRFV